jgi:phosphonate transport system permease protein
MANQIVKEQKTIDISINSEDSKFVKTIFLSFALDITLWAYAILATYKIIYEKLILEIRYPVFTWEQPLISLVVAGAISLILFFIPRFSIGKVVTGMYEKPQNHKTFKQPYAIIGLIIFLITLIVGFKISQVSMNEFLSESGLAGARRIFTALLNPNWDILEESLFAAIETIYMAFIATVIALPIAFILSFFAARNLMIGSRFFFTVYTLVRFLLNMTRAIEPLVWAIIFSVWVGIGPFSGMLALCLHSIASLTKLYSEQIENINDGPIEAITATGAHPIQVVWYGVVPQIVLPFLSFTIYRWDINVRMATVIGLVGGGGIGTMLMQYQGIAKWNEVGLLVLIIAAIVWIMDYTSAKIREAIK